MVSSVENGQYSLPNKRIRSMRYALSSVVPGALDILRMGFRGLLSVGDKGSLLPSLVRRCRGTANFAASCTASGEEIFLSRLL